MVVYNPAGFLCERDFTATDGTVYQRGDLIPASAVYAERKRDVLLSKRYVSAIWDLSFRKPQNHRETPGPSHAPTDSTGGTRLFDSTPHANQRTYLTRPGQDWPAFDGSEITA